MTNGAARTDRATHGTPGTARDLIEVGLFSAVVAADALGIVPLTQTIFQLPLIWVFLRLRGERWFNLGFARPARLLGPVLIGSVAGVVMELLAVLVTTPWISSLFGVEPDYSGLKGIRGNAGMLVLFLALNWTLAAVGEELCFRGFLMNRVARILGGGRGAWVLSLVLGSALFGWGHTEQGVSGWVQEGLSGLLLGVLFLLGGRNLTIPIVAHGVSNTVAFILIYLGRYPGLNSLP
ncbi:MAG: CPBP family intramembrane metalloprotease [Bryobacterales bacterium]|nr:CPBP family intramembrane metalloprotease [Bryobacterales bacterium]